MTKFMNLSPQAQRLVVIIVSAPILASTSWVLYRRVIQGEEQKTGAMRRKPPTE